MNKFLTQFLGFHSDLHEGKFCMGITQKDPQIEVINSSLDPILAERRLEKEWPDVFILDIRPQKFFDKDQVCVSVPAF